MMESIFRFSLYSFFYLYFFTYSFFFFLPVLTDIFFFFVMAAQDGRWGNTPIIFRFFFFPHFIYC